jgi:glycine cleavage system transcriptional repressor
MNRLAVTVLGHDRPGIIARTTGALAELGGNLEDSSMTLLRGHFAMTLFVGCDVDEHAVAQALAFLETEGLVVSVLALPDEPESTPDGEPFLVSVHGADRAGIVSAVTGAVADVGGNVTDLSTRLAGSLYVLIAEVDLRPDTDLEALRARLSDIAERLGVDVSLRAADPDLL